MNLQSAKRKIMEYVQYVKVEHLKHTRFNPHLRTEEKRMKKLIESIRDKGVIVPIVVNAETNEVIEGNRRLAIAKLLGIHDIPAVMLYGTSKNEAKGIYVDLNTTPRRFSEAEKLASIHNGGPKTWGRANNDYDTLSRILSREELEELIANGKGGRLVGQSRQLCRRIGWPDDVDNVLRKVVLWMHRTGSQRDTGIVTRRGDRTDTRKIRSAVENGNPIFPRRKKK